MYIGKRVLNIESSIDVKTVNKSLLFYIPTKSVSIA